MSNGRRAAHRSLSFPIGRVAGIQIRVHVTFFLLVPLFALAGAQPGGPGEFGAIGVFVYFGAAAEEAGTIAHVRLGHRVVGDVMLIDPVVVETTTSAAALHDINRRTAQRVFPVVGPNGYEGMVEPVGLAPGQTDTTVDRLEHHSVPVLAPSDGLEDSLPTVVQAPGRAVAVLEGSRVVGVLRFEEVEHLLREPAGPERRAGGSS